MSVSSLKVLLLASWYPRKGTNGGGFILSQAEALERMCSAAIVDASDHRSLLPRYIRIWLRKWKIFKRFEKPALIHAHVAFPAGAIAQWLARRWDIPVVLTEHTGPLSLLFPYFKDAERYGVHLDAYDKVIAVSSFQAKNLRSLSIRVKPTVVGNIVEDVFLQTPLTSAPAQNRALFVGSLTKAKGWDDLIAVLNTVENNAHSLDITVIGDGELPPLPSWKHIRMRKLSRADRSELLREMQSHSFLILTSEYESFSLVAAEALALGRAVVGYDCGGPKDFVSDERGVLLPERSAAALAEKIQEFSLKPQWGTDPELMALRRKFIAKRYSADVIASELLRIYDGVIRDFMGRNKA